MAGASVSMDFFGQQDRARSRTRRLVLVFAAAVLLTLLAIYLAVAVLFQLAYHILGGAFGPANGGLLFLVQRFGPAGLWQGELFGWVTVLVLTVVVSGSSLKIWQLSRGGAALAEALGGRRLDPSTTDLDERKLLNIVEEMAIASGLPVPETYVLDEEFAINAFAAGHGASDAVLGVTFGALKLLDRDEMQGVVAHEFSHILNGDMRLNLRLIGWLHGILGLVILGRVLTLTLARAPQTKKVSEPSRGHRAGPIFHPMLLPPFLLGMVCLVAGSIGALFARIVKSAVSRQREFLADAAAVQFTRNPDGLAGALVKTGGLRAGSVIQSARAEEASHLFFGDGLRRRWFRFTSTHPPLAERIRRLKPAFDGRFPAVSAERVLRESPISALYREHAGAGPVDYERLASVIGPAAAAREVLFATAAGRSAVDRTISVTEIRSRVLNPSAAHLDYAARWLASIPEPLCRATREPFAATALVCAMVCSQDPDARARQVETLLGHADPGLAAELSRLQRWIDRLDPAAFLPLAELCVRALRQLSPPQYEAFRTLLQELIEEDREIDLFEYMLQRMIVRHLDPLFRPARRTPVQYYTLNTLLPDCAVLLSGLARVGHGDEATAAQAFKVGAAQLAPDSALTLLAFGECNLPQMDEALSRLSQATPRLRQQLLASLLLVVATDGQVNRREAELLRAVSDALDLPAPPFLTAAEAAARDAAPA